MAFPPQLSSGLTAKATVSDTAVAVLASTPGTNKAYEVTIINEGAVAGFYSLDGGTTLARLPAGPCSITLDLRKHMIDLNLYVQRVASGSNLSAIYASALVAPTY